MSGAARRKLFADFRCLDELGPHWQQAVYEVLRLMLRASTRRGEVSRNKVETKAQRRARHAAKRKPKILATRLTNRERSAKWRANHPEAHRAAAKRWKVKARQQGREFGLIAAECIIRNKNATQSAD